jgi:hypothetical protein
MSTETKLQQIANTINAERNDDSIDRNYYNHWERFESLCAEHGIDIDDERQEREDPEAAYTMFAEGGWELHLSGGEWCVGESEEEEAPSTKTQRITIETTEANGNRLGAGTYWIEMPADYDVDAITGEDVLLDDALRIMPELGEMVCGGETDTDDYDEGEVIDYAGADALVAWDSGVRTWAPTGLLTAL